MFETVKMLHSYWAYLTLLMIVIASLNSLFKFFGKKEFRATDFRISLFTLIVTHIQLLLGIILFFAGSYLSVISEKGMGIMKDDHWRPIIIEHPLMMIIAVVLITIGYSKHKKKLTSQPKFKMLAIYYTLALVCVLAMIPWKTWF